MLLFQIEDSGFEVWRGRRNYRTDHAVLLRAGWSEVFSGMVDQAVRDEYRECSRQAVS
jgi:hypothetical protein